MAPDRDIRRDVLLPTAWEWVATTRDTVRNALEGYEQDLLDATVMASSELAENVVSHGEPMPGGEPGRITLLVGGGSIKLESQNGCGGDRAQVVIDIIARIARSDPEALYLERLQRMLEQPHVRGSQLGLIRIAYEGGFCLAGTFEGGVLTIAAERKLQ